MRGADARKWAPGRALLVPAAVAALLLLTFLAGRYGWKLLGFRACQSAVIETVEVTDGAVRLTGRCPGLVPKGFCGCCSRERDGRLYVGFRFSAVFGFFEAGYFDVTIPVKGEIGEVRLKTGAREDTIWSREAGAAPGAAAAAGPGHGRKGGGTACEQV